MLIGDNVINVSCDTEYSKAVTGNRWDEPDYYNYSDIFGIVNGGDINIRTIGDKKASLKINVSAPNLLCADDNLSKANVGKSNVVNGNMRFLQPMKRDYGAYGIYSLKGTPRTVTVREDCVVYGALSNTDARLILQRLVGKISEFPREAE